MVFGQFQPAINIELFQAEFRGHVTCGVVLWQYRTLLSKINIYNKYEEYVIWCIAIFNLGLTVDMAKGLRNFG